MRNLSREFRTTKFSVRDRKMYCTSAAEGGAIINDTAVAVAERKEGVIFPSDFPLRNFVTRHTSEKRRTRNIEGRMWTDAVTRPPSSVASLAPRGCGPSIVERRGAAKRSARAKGFVRQSKLFGAKRGGLGREEGINCRIRRMNRS